MLQDGGMRFTPPSRSLVGHVSNDRRKKQRLIKKTAGLSSQDLERIAVMKRCGLFTSLQQLAPAADAQQFAAPGSSGSAGSASSAATGADSSTSPMDAVAVTRGGADAGISIVDREPAAADLADEEDHMDM